MHAMDLYIKINSIPNAWLYTARGDNTHPPLTKLGCLSNNLIQKQQSIIKDDCYTIIVCSIVIMAYKVFSFPPSDFTLRCP